jgi:hypothetical protein
MQGRTASIELMFSKTGEWNVPVWVASLDTCKTFDRVFHGPLIAALRKHGVPAGHASLLQLLYNRSGQVRSGQARFARRRPSKGSGGFNMKHERACETGGSGSHLRMQEIDAGASTRMQRAASWAQAP